VVVRENGVPEVLLVHRPRYDDWSFPKGKAHEGESDEDCALREVGEETGLEVRIVEPLPSIEYAFVQDGTRIHKTVHYFLMEPIGGDLSRHDAEFERVRWVAFDEAGTLLSFATERELVATAAARISGDPEMASRELARS